MTPTRPEHAPRRRGGLLFETLEIRRLLSNASTEPVASAQPAPPSAGALDASYRADTGFTNTAAVTAEAATFLAPGILHTEADFERMRQKVAAGAQPWAAGWNALISDGYSQINSAPRPLETVIRGGTGQNFAQMVIDMQRTYQLALRWKVSGNTAFADHAVAFLNAWSATHTTLTGNADRFLASGLYGFGWAAAADIMRSYPGWAAADVTRFQNYLLNVYYPLQEDFLYGGDDGVHHNGAAITNYWANWDLANIEGMMAIGIFSERQDIYDAAVDYLFNGGGNGALDKAFYYLHPGNLMQWQESGRDQGHTTLGMGLFGHIARMAWNQGLDLFSYNNYQFLAAAEYIARYNLGHDVPFETYNWGNGQSGTWSTHTAVSSAARGHGRLVYELIHAHYVERLGMAAPYTTQRVMNLRPEWRGGGDEFGFGTLTYPLDPLATGLTPRGLTAAEKGAGSVQLNWFGSANASGYNVYRSTSENGTYAQVASNVSDLLTYTDRNLPAGIYYYRVAGILADGGGGGGETDFSNVVSATSTHLAHAHLPFDETGGTSAAADVTGNGHDATLINGPTWAPGRSGNALSLDGVNDYAELPAGVMTDVEDFTIAAWVNLNTTATWSRIVDFGDDRGRWMFLTPRNSGGVMEFATSTVYGYNAQRITANFALPANLWVHVAVTLSDRVGKLYVNGVLVGANTNMSFPPAQIRSTPRNWIGRSQFTNDPYLNGRIDDFRISRGAMAAGELYTLATGNPAPMSPAAPATLAATAVPGNQINLSWSAVSGASGYTVLRSTTSAGPYTPIATRLTATTFSDTGRVAGTTYFYVVTAYNNGGDGGNSPQASVVALPPMPAAPTNLVASGSSSTTISLTWNGSLDAATYSVKRALASGGPFATIASGLTMTGYTDTGRTAGTTYYYVVTAVNAAGESGHSNVDGATPSDLIAHLKFDQSSGTTATDAGSNGWNGTLVNGPLWTTSGRMGNALDLDGSDDHVTLPTGVINGVTDFTIATWVFQDAAANWTRVFDFGTGQTRNMFLTPQNGANGRVRFAITTSGGAGEQQITGSAPLPVGAWTHVAVTLSGSVGILYVNGVEVARNSGMTLNPNALGSTNLNYIGRSQYPDPYLNGRIDDFRIYARALAAGEVNTLAAGNVPAAPANLTATPGDNQVYLAWPAVPGASSYTIKRATTFGGPHTTIAAGVTTTTRTDTAVTNGTTYYYVVTASSIIGEGAASPQAAATPFPSTFTGTSDADQWMVRRSGDDLLIWAGDDTGPATFTLPYGDVTSLTFIGDGGDDTLTLDSTATTAIPAGGITFDAGNDDDALIFNNPTATDAQRVNFVGGDGRQTITVDGGALTLGSDVSATGGSVALNLTNAATVTLAAVQQLAAVNIAGGARLDVRNQKLIVTGMLPGVATGGTYGGVQGLVQAGYTYGEWSGSGIVTTMPDAAAARGITTLAVAPAAEVLFIAAHETALWAGRTVSGSDTIVMYTYAGDLNFDGLVDGADYGVIDNSVQFPGTGGFWNGDFNYDGIIDGADYGLIDNAIQLQGARL